MVFVDIKNNTVSLPQTVLKIPCRKYSGFGGTNKPGKFFTSYQKHPRFVAAGTAGNVLTSCQKDPNFLAINTAGECPDLGQKKKKSSGFTLINVQMHCWKAATVFATFAARNDNTPVRSTSQVTSYRIHAMWSGYDSYFTNVSTVNMIGMNSTISHT